MRILPPRCDRVAWLSRHGADGGYFLVADSSPLGITAMDYSTVDCSLTNAVVSLSSSEKRSISLCLQFNDSKLLTLPRQAWSSGSGTETIGEQCLCRARTGVVCVPLSVFYSPSSHSASGGAGGDNGQEEEEEEEEEEGDGLLRFALCKSREYVQTVCERLRAIR